MCAAYMSALVVNE